MKNLIVWLNSIINKHKALKRWRRVVTVLAAIMTFVTTYALILPAITVEKNKVEDVGGMYLEQEADTNDMLEENALEPIGVSIAAEHENAVTFTYADDSMTATAVFGTNDEIPAGAELVVTPIDPESVEYTSLSNRAAELLDKEFIYDVTTCSFYDFALVLNNVDVTPKTGLVDIQIIFHDNTVEHLDDTFFAGRFARSADDSSDVKDELVSVNPDESSVIELTDGIITALSLKGNDLSETDSLVGILAGNVDEEIKAAAAETDAEIPDSEDAQEESAQADSAGTDGEEAAPKVGTLKASGSDYTVTLTYDATSEIPEGASLTVSEIAQNSKEYKKYLEETKKAMGLTEEETLPQYAARFFDIKIMVGGDEFVPESGVTVEIAYTEPLAANPETEVNAVHFHNDTTEPEVIEANVTEISSDGTSNVEFTAEAFSVYGVVYTVDFHWEVNGKEFEFSIPGGGYLSFAKLVEILGVADKDARDEDVLILDVAQVSEETEKFVADVEKVEFSNPELVWVGKADEETTVGALKQANGLKAEYSAQLTEEDIERVNAQTVPAGDWALISLQPFTSEETLTVTMKDGEVFFVRVTDAVYDGSLVTALDGATGALINRTNRNAVLNSSLNNTALQAVDVTINGNQIETVNTSSDLSQWTFSYIGQWNNNNYYTVRSSDGRYLNIGGNGGDNGYATVSDNPQNLIVRTRNTGGVQEIRIGGEANNRTYALNNVSNQTTNGYAGYGNWGWNENPGEWFTVYQLTVPQIGDLLDGQSLAIINNRDGGSNWQALRDEIDGTKDSRGYYVSGNATTYTNVDGVDYSSSNDVFWTFEYVKSDDTGSYYRIKTSNGYLYIDPNVTKKSDMPSNQSHNYEHALRLESAPGDGSANDGTLIRIVPNGDGTYLLQNRNGVCLWNYDNNQFWLSTLDKDNESSTAKLNSRFRLTQRPVVNHVTVHYVDREGHILTGVQYTGGQSAVVDNHDGTFTIPYDISGNVDLRAQFNFKNVSRDGSTPSEYTYGSTHLAGDGYWSGVTYEGYVIDSVLTASNGDLIYHSDSGETEASPGSWGPNDPGNRDYQTLIDYSLSGVANKRPSGQTGQIVYAQEVNKDIYVILDPLPGPTAASSSGSTEMDAEPPALSKTMVPNNDGTYTLSLKVDAHGKNLTETNKANILFIVDTSSSMRKVTTNGHNRIEDTHDAVLDFGQDLLAYNTNHPDAVQLSMITFDGSVVDRLPWTTDTTTFKNSVNDFLVYKYLHQGTDWEDALKRALEICKNPPDTDPTFVVFFTDGEPSQYTNFHGAQQNPNADPTGHYTGDNDDPGTKYPNFYSYFLSRETSKDEVRAIVDTGVQLYGIYAYNPPPSSPYVSYLGSEGGAQLLHNTLKYGYNTDDDLTNDVFFDAQNTGDVQNAFNKIFNSITEKVGFSNVVVEDGITAGVTSSTVIEGDVSGFTYIIRDNTGALAYKVTVAPNGVSNLPDGVTAEDGDPLFWFSESGPPVVGEKKTVSMTRIIKDAQGNPVLDGEGKIQTEPDEVEAYYYKDANDKEYIMPISTTGEHVSWDLSPLGLLKDGYSYEVNFVVWPNQESYDLVANLNNGKRPDIEATANWANCPIKTDSAGRQYRQGGFPNYPYISRYEDNGVYSAMSNTEQKVDYYKFDRKIVGGEEVTVITHGSKEVPPPDPMPLTASYSRIEKLWNYERDPGIFAQYLYNTDGSSKAFNVDFNVFQGEDLVPYTDESLGWVYDLDNNGNYIYLGENESGDYVLEEGTGRRIKGHYVWAPGDTMSNVTYATHAHSIGTRWVTDFSIATGLMLTVGEMNRLGLNKSLYPSTVFEGETYYILEPGHDYTIKEQQAGTIGYEFDFISPVYHPMLVNGVLRNVEIQYTYKPDPDDPEKTVIDTATISSITGSEEGLSGLEIENTLRGYINLNKIVVDEDGERVESDNTKFKYTIKLESPTTPGPFEGDHIPWYGINGLFYNDGSENYYQVYEAQGGVWMIRNEAGKEYELISTGFDPDEEGAQTVTYKVNADDQEGKQITLYGNQMTASANGTIATVTVAITQTETLYIANVPVGTTYTITETNTDDYTLIDILKEVKNGTAVEKSEHVTDLSGRQATGTIVTNRDNHVTYTNKVLTGALKITKEIQKNGTKDNSATGTFYYAVYDKPYDPNADPPMEPVRTGYIEVTSGGSAEVTESDLKVGNYYVYELTGEGGTPVTGGGIYSGGKYYSVTTTGSPATVTLGNTSTVGIVNNYETIPVTATKSWADNNPDQLTVYFKLFYKNAAGVDVTTGTSLKPLAPGVTSVTWDDMPKYNENGQAYNYIVREYILDDENGEFSEGGHKYTEAAPNGYVNTEAGLTVTNSKMETYDPITTYSGIKLWVDTVNGSKTRPDGLKVTLMIDKEPFNNPAGDVPAVDKDGNTPQLAWVTVDEDEWRYTFHNLPMFDENKQIIYYYAVETPVNGYAASTTDQINTKYEYKSHTLDHTKNDAYPVMSSDADLVYCAVRIQHEGHLHHIWTQRVPTAEEKNRLVSLVNADLIANDLPGNATVDNVHWVDGLPINHEFVWKAQPNGYRVSFTRYNTNTIHVKVDNHGAFSNICYGTIQYDYTAGSTNFRNELQPTSQSVEKTWADGKTPPEGSVIVVELQGTVQRPVDPKPDGATETVYETVPVDLVAVGITQKIQVTLNGGKAGGDDTAEAWKYTWSNLPQYNKVTQGDPLKISYSVKEISYTIGDHIVSLHDFAPTENNDTEGVTKITNQIPEYNFEILKIDADTATPLKGAKFTIQAIQPTSTTETPVKVNEASPSTPDTTGDNGKVNFNDIPLGYYEVEEIHLPDGYILTYDGKFYVRIDTDGVKLLEKVIADGDTQPKLSFREVVPGPGGRIILGNVELTKSGNTITFTVENTPGASLPNTGGPGTRLFTILGSILILGAGVLLWRRRRLI